MEEDDYELPEEESVSDGEKKKLRKEYSTIIKEYNKEVKYARCTNID